jgi:hypothetical protein
VNKALNPDDAAVDEGAKKTAKLNAAVADPGIATPPVERSVVPLFAKLTMP